MYVQVCTTTPKCFTDFEPTIQNSLSGRIVGGADQWDLDISFFDKNAVAKSLSKNYGTCCVTSYLISHYTPIAPIFISVSISLSLSFSLSLPLSFSLCLSLSLFLDVCVCVFVCACLCYSLPLYLSSSFIHFSVFNLNNLCID